MSEPRQLDHRPDHEVKAPAQYFRGDVGQRGVQSGEIGLHDRRERLLQQRHGDGFRFREQMGEELVEMLVAIQGELQIHEGAHERFHRRRAGRRLKLPQAPHTLVVDGPDAVLECSL